MPIVSLAFAFGGAGVWSVLTGNLTAFMHLALLALLLQRASRDTPQSSGFWILLAVFATIKPYFIGYGLVPLVMARERLPQLLRWLAAAIFSSSAMLLSWWMAPLWSGRYLQALVQQTLGSDDLGMSFFGLILRVLRHQKLLALCGHICCALGLLGLALLYCVRRERQDRDASMASIGVLYFALTWANPRMMIYDLFPALIALGTALVLAGVDFGVHGPAALCIAALPLLIAWAQSWLGVELASAFSSAALWQTLATGYLAAMLARRARLGSRLPKPTALGVTGS